MGGQKRSEAQMPPLAYLAVAAGDPEATPAAAALRGKVSPGRRGARAQLAGWRRRGWGWMGGWKDGCSRLSGARALRRPRARGSAVDPRPPARQPGWSPRDAGGSCSQPGPTSSRRHRRRVPPSLLSARPPRPKQPPARRPGDAPVLHPAAPRPLPSSASAGRPAGGSPELATRYPSPSSSLHASPLGLGPPTWL